MLNKKTKKVKSRIRAGTLLFTALSILLFSDALSLKAQTIPQYFFGENAWMPDTIGEGATKVYLAGKLHDNWKNVQQSNVKLVRFGGTTTDFNMPSRQQYLRMVDSIRAKGMEPILQLSFGNSNYDTAQALPIFRYINGTMNRHVKYWSIGNEPDRYSTNKTAQKIATFTKRYAIGMKKFDPSVLIVGPALSYIHASDSNDPLQKLADTLSSTADSTKSIVGIIWGNGSASGKAVIDFWDYHMYNYDGSGSNTKSRYYLIRKLTSTITTYNGDSTCMGWLKRRCNSVTGRNGNPLKPMITEANICTQDTTSACRSTDIWTGTKSSGFFSGQQTSEMLALACYKGIESLDFWSVIEGSEMGYMTHATSPVKKSSYYHIKEMAKWFAGTLYLGDDRDAGTNPIANIKAFGSKGSNYIAVMILNQDSTAVDTTYTVSLNSTFPTVGIARIRMNMGVNNSYYDTISARSTTILIFDLNGNISQKYQYKQSDGSTQPGFHQKYNECGISKTFTQSTLDNNYYPAVFSRITLGDGTNAIQIKNTDNSIFHAVNSITLNKNFSSGSVGQTLSLIIDPTCQ